MWLGYSFPQALFHSDIQVAGKVGRRDIGTKILVSICIFERSLIVETIYEKENDRKGKCLRTQTTGHCTAWMDCYPCY